MAAAPELPHLDGLGYRDALAALADAGCTQLARGDWSQVVATPDGRHVVRVCPFDPAYLMHARACQRHVEIPCFQRVARIELLNAGGHAVTMERLEPAPEDRAGALCRRLLYDGPSRDPALEAARRVLRDNEARGRAQLLCWGGLDLRPGNVLQDEAGRLKVVDPYFVAGRELVAAILRDAAAVARRYPVAHLLSFLDIPPFADEDPPGPVAAELRRRLEAVGRGGGAP